MGKKFNLTWHTFSSHGQELFRDLMESQEFSDVTLVSDDQHQYRVHKFILSACSTVFRKILTSTSLNTLIYLRGIHHQELESILQFIYLGEVTLNHERINEFLNVSKNLDIKEIGKNVVNKEEETENVNEIENFDENDLIQSDVNPINDETAIGSPAIQELRNTSSSSIINDQKKPYKYKCQQCDYQEDHKSNLNRHVQTKHEGITFPCQQCDYKATNQSNLQRHFETKHEDTKYPCQQCDYQATNLRNLQFHIHSKHEGIKYPCQECDYQATHPSSLQMHIKSKHEGVKYPCQQCDYQATQLSHLKRHVKAKHLFNFNFI